jgi:hypothetical protein
MSIHTVAKARVKVVVEVVDAINLPIKAMFTVRSAANRIMMLLAVGTCMILML